MSYISGKEKWKFYLLMFLVLLSLIQVGILWNYQTHGFPINALWGVFTQKEKVVQDDIKEYFKPVRIIVAEGFDEPRWILGENNANYGLLWNEAKNYIARIVKSGNTISNIGYSDEAWSDLIIKRSIIFEFKYPMSIELISAFLEIKAENKPEIKAVSKIVILPFEDVNNNLLIYINDEERILGFSQKINQDDLSRNRYNGIIRSFEENKDLRKYSVVKEVIPDLQKALFRIKPDIPVIVSGNKYDRFLAIEAVAPESIIKSDLNKNYDLEKIAKEVLGTRKDEYDLGVDIYGTVVFKNLNDIYRIYKEGILEYRTLYNIESLEEVNESTAFDKAVNFINDRLDLVRGSLHLIGASKIKNENCFEFKFDYYINDMSVFFEGFEIKNKAVVPITNAITICANNKNVVSCLWVLRKFNVLNKTTSYNVLFEDMLEDIFKMNQDINHEKFSIEDIKMIYKVSFGGEVEKLEPCWLVTTIDKKQYLVPVHEEKGE